MRPGAADPRERVVSFAQQPLMTEDNLVVHIDTALYFRRLVRSRGLVAEMARRSL